MPRLKIMKNSENEIVNKNEMKNKTINKKSNKKNKKPKATKKKKDILKSEEIVFENRIEDFGDRIEDTFPFADEELDSGLNEETVGEEIKDEAVEEISDEAGEETNEEINDEAGDEVNDEIVQETKFKKVKKNTSLYELLSRPFGATMEELEKELNWKKASIRGTISNLQKEQQFCLITINVIKPNLNLNNKSFYKETRYFIKDCEFNLFNDLLNKLSNQ